MKRTMNAGYPLAVPSGNQGGAGGYKSVVLRRQKAHPRSLPDFPSLSAASRAPASSFLRNELAAGMPLSAFGTMLAESFSPLSL
jgi:hypothetical protein